ncbi:MAG: glycosyltransferase [Candidatus Magasanikbacteria bacterium]|nr:glycosyltransferase [Candidatus Magasanikbacteria bacterium]
MIPISVVMAVHNDERYLTAAIRSILDQTWRDFEFLIVNDGSTDGSDDILQEFARKDPRIILVKQDHLGLTAALNVGCRRARGGYMARMDSDDIAAPDRLEKQYHYLEAHPMVAVCGAQGWFINANGRTIGEKNLPCAAEDIRRRLLFNNQCIHSSLFIRKSAFAEAGGYDAHFRKSQDYELLLRLATKYDVVNLPERLVYWRVRSTSLSWQSKAQEWYAILARWRAITRYGYPKLRGLLQIGLRLGWLTVPQRWKMRRYT